MASDSIALPGRLLTLSNLPSGTSPDGVEGRYEASSPPGTVRFSAKRGGAAEVERCAPLLRMVNVASNGLGARPGFSNALGLGEVDRLEATGRCP
jgi:hypothetical protein